MSSKLPFWVNSSESHLSQGNMLLCCCCIHLCKQPLCVPSLYPWPAVCVPRVVSCTHPVLQPFIQSDATNLSSSYSFYWGFPHGCMTIMLQVDFVGGNGIILEVFPVLMVMMCSKMPGEPETSSLPICFYPTCALYHQFVNHM